MNIFRDYRIVQNQVLTDEFIKRSLIALKVQLGVSSKQIYPKGSISVSDDCFIIAILNKLNSFIIVKLYVVMNFKMLPGMVNYPPRHYFTVSAIVTVKNEFISVMQLLNAVRVQKDYDLEYTINNNIKLSEGYIGNYYDSITYKYDVLLLSLIHI